MKKLQKKHLECGDVKEGDIVVVYLTLMQQIYGGFTDTFKVSHVEHPGYRCHARASSMFPSIPFTIDGVIAIYRKETPESDYQLIWYDEEHKEDALEIRDYHLN